MDYSNDCRSKWCLKPRWMAVAFALLSVLTFSCDEDEVVSKESLAPGDLRYANVSEVYEGKAMESGRPVVFSATKPTFEIVAGSAEENGVYLEDEFQIVDTTGIVSLKADNNLVAGKYFLDIKVSNAIGETVFPKVFELTILPSAIEGLQYSPSTQVLVRGNAQSKTSAPVFKGSKPVTFALIEESDFVINSETGEISLPADSEIDAGSYKLSVRTINAADTSKFNGVVTIQVETKPYELAYAPQEYLDIQQKQAKQSVKPTIKGTEPITFSLKEDFGAFTIDEQTGLISLAEGHALDINTYNLTVVATNAHGSVEFANAASFQIVEIKAVLPSQLQYSETSYTAYEGYAFATDVPTVSGSTPMTFALADNHGAFAIDENTGAISLAEGNVLATGTYSLTVTATNLKGTASFENIVTVTVKEAVEVQIFEDGWDNLSPAVGEKRLGNMAENSVKENPIQASNNKWTRGWGNWTVLDQAGANARGAVMIPEKTENDDWLIAEAVDLQNAIYSKLYLSGYSRYGKDANNTLKLLVSEDYAGDVQTANWTEVSFESFFNFTKAQDRIIDLSAFDGKKVTIALRHESFMVEGDVDGTNLTRTSYILNFEVKAIQK